MAGRGLFQSAPPGSLPGRSRVPQFALEGLIALSLAFLVWLYIHTRDHESLDNVPIPVQVQLAPENADHYDLEVAGPPQVMVSFFGPPSRIRELRGMLQRGEVRVTIPLSVPEDRRNESRYRDAVGVHGSDVPVPPGVTALVAEGSNRIAVTLYRLVGRRLPVRLNQATEDRIGQQRITPQTVLVRGPEEVLEHAQVISTRPYHVPSGPRTGPGQQKQVSVRLALMREIEGRPVHVLPSTVQVRYTLRPRPRLYQLRQVPVTFLCPPAFPYRPQFRGESGGKIMLRVKGPAAAEAPAVSAYIDLTSRGIKPGLNIQPIQVQLPRDCQLAQEPPGPLEFDLVPTETAAKWLGVVTEP
jgi:hypothetical protein